MSNRCAVDIAEGRCPHSGLPLHREGEAGPDRLSCGICDCFGFPINPKEGDR